MKNYLKNMTIEELSEFLKNECNNSNHCPMNKYSETLLEYNIRDFEACLLNDCCGCVKTESWIKVLNEESK